MQSTAFAQQPRSRQKTETGWCKIRDGVVLPLLMQGGVAIIKTVLSKTIKATAVATA